MWIRATARTTALLLFAAAACADGDGDGPAADTETSAAAATGAGGDYEPVRMDLQAAPEARSFTGAALHPLAQDAATAARLYAQIDSAEAAYRARPDDPDVLVWLGRRYAYAGHYRDAIDAFTEGMGRHPDDARFYRHRGHRYITVRELDRAIADLDHAARLTSGAEEVVEPDGMPNAAGIPRSTLQTNIWYHLGLARYLEHDFEGAVHAYRRGWELSANDDMRVAMADWLWLALMRLGRDAEADALLDEISPDMDILENHAYLHRLLVYKGELSPDSLMGGSLAEADPLNIATHGYGLGAWHLIRGDEARARMAFQRVLDTGYWPAFGYIAAEVELAALEAPAPPVPTGSARP